MMRQLDDVINDQVVFLSQTSISIGDAEVGETFHTIL